MIERSMYMCTTRISVPVYIHTIYNILIYNLICTNNNHTMVYTTKHKGPHHTPHTPTHCKCSTCSCARWAQELTAVSTSFTHE